jgi:hypothetical protein
LNMLQPPHTINHIWWRQWFHSTRWCLPLTFAASKKTSQLVIKTINES